jgi:3-methyladenine DNA glycosylase AlkD
LDANAVADELEARLRLLADPVRAVQEKRYLKSARDHLGASVPAIRKTAKDFLRAHPDLGRADLLALVEALWDRGIHECSLCAVEMLTFRVGLLDPSDLGLLERLLREAKTWALVDNLSASVAGPLVEKHPCLADTLDRWAADEDFWLRRSALLALLPPLRRGEGDFDRFSRYADALLGEKEFFIRKAIGWVLREVSKKRPELVHAWLLPRAARASGLTVREATKYLPDSLRRDILAARAK